MGWINQLHLKKGSFRRYCGGKVTCKCIQRGLKSKNPKTRARARLAKAFFRMHGKKC